MTPDETHAALKAFAKLLAPLVADELKAVSHNPDELLSVRQVAKLLRIRQEKAKRLILLGEIARPRGMKRLRVSRRELERYTSATDSK
jgi:DUF1009 family protein